MPTNGDDLLKKIQDLRKSGKDLDSGIYRDVSPQPNEALNKAIGAPKGTIMKPVPMPSYEPDPNEMVDFPGIGKVRRGNIKALKKGGAINLKDCEVRTAEGKNSKHKNCW